LGSVKIGLKPCNTCGRQISASASKCPHCGQSNPTMTPFKDMSTAGKVAYTGFMGAGSIVFIICFIIIFIVILMLI